MNKQIQDQVCELSWAIKLKEVGVPQESNFYWLIDREEKSKAFINYKSERGEIYSAFMVSELDDLLYIYYSKMGEEQMRNILLHTSYSNSASARAALLLKIYEGIKIPNDIQ